MYFNITLNVIFFTTTDYMNYFSDAFGEEEG